jgi:hypothetical protein
MIQPPSPLMIRIFTFLILMPALFYTGILADPITSEVSSSPVLTPCTITYEPGLTLEQYMENKLQQMWQDSIREIFMQPSQSKLPQLRVFKLLLHINGKVTNKAETKSIGSHKETNEKSKETDEESKVRTSVPERNERY